MPRLPVSDPLQFGMTLLEVMIVLAVVGIAAGAVSLGIGATSRQASVRAEATRLAERLQLAADQAMVDDRGVALVWDPKGYGFALFNGTPRLGTPHDTLDRHHLPAGIQLDLPHRGPLVPVTAGDRAAVLSARLTQGDTVWDVRFDGVTAEAVGVNEQ